MTALFFNLLVNSAFSMLGGLLVVAFFIWFFRIESGPMKLFFLSLPFLKIVYDCLRGLPPDSVLLAGLDPYMLPPKHQTLSMGGGFSYWGPMLNVAFTVRDLAGQNFAASVGDYLVIWLNRRFGAELPFTILCMVLTVSMTLVGLRLIQGLKFEKLRRSDRKLGQLFRVHPLNYRFVDIYISKGFSGTPFTGGILRPYICIPKNAFDQLNSQELEAVISHELGHVVQFDLLTTILVQFLGDLFWFVPGYRWLSRKIDRLREVVADQFAVNLGAEPALLASALIKLKEMPEPTHRFILYSAFFREKSLLKIRVDRLIGTTKELKPRFGWQIKGVRVIFSLWIFSAVMFATLGGNHRSLRMQNPVWLNQFFGMESAD